jgi:glutathione S-transferase
MSTPVMWSWHLSPFSGKARIALAFKQVEVQLLEINPAKRPAALRALNPSNTVPVLVIGDVAIRESTPICEWAQESGPGPSLWPADPAERARARGLLRWVDDELSVNFFLSMRKEAFGLAPTDHPDLVNTLRTTLVKRWKALDALLAASGGPWLNPGDEPTLTDLAALPLAVRLTAWKPELAPDAEQHPRAAAWLRTLAEHPLAVEVDRRGIDPPE